MGLKSIPAIRLPPMADISLGWSCRSERALTKYSVEREWPPFTFMPTRLMGAAMVMRMDMSSEMSSPILASLLNRDSTSIKHESGFS